MRREFGRSLEVLIFSAEVVEALVMLVDDHFLRHGEVELASRAKEGEEVRRGRGNHSSSKVAAGENELT